MLLQGGLSSADARLDVPTRSLIEDTISFINSDEFNTVFGVCLDRGTDVLIQGLREGVFEGGQEEDDGKLETDGVRLAAMLPAVARWSHLAVNGIPNELVEVRFFMCLVCPIMEVLIQVFCCLFLCLPRLIRRVGLDDVGMVPDAVDCRWTLTGAAAK